MNETKEKRNPLFVYFLILIPLSVIVEALIVTKNIGILYSVLMWIPAVAAFVAAGWKGKRSGEKFTLLGYFRSCGFRRCGVKYILLGIALPFVYLLVPYLVYWTLYPDNFAYTGVQFSVILKDLAPMTIVGIFAGLLTATGEEIGWRGFMVPELWRKYGLNKTLLFSGLIWVAWHLPLLIFGDYMEGAPLWYQLPAFLLCILPVGIIAGLLALRTRSLWPTAFLHAAHNNFDQSIFGVITRGDNRMYFVSETGLLTIACAWVLAVVMYVLMRDKITKSNTTCAKQ